ncbi:MAG: PIN domain-containing protein [Prevotella sp.]|nr:PIN domain-containing protein [Prevotella sp.]
MRVFIDTNVFLDYIQQRQEGWREAEVIFYLAIHGDIELLVSDLTIANMRYVTRKDIPLEQFYAVMKSLRKYYTIVGVGSASVDEAYRVESKDFEDALQYFSAEQAGADCIITRNIKDFDFSSSVEALEPQDFLFKFFPNEL